ncbi:hypothetical protein NDU88_003661 [Pleurodeles waltl]|uniref:Uncharacterized protein n=1 Tax=Pleurodeles waltl TaxID=8319 RepID=A0AAV7NHB6_PLEWA|nr:hypothetical protein NDU88_003661 [Pleurodeles waltl]
MEPNRVVQALKVLHDEGREDLLREGVLEQAWVGIKRPKRLSAEGVSAAVAACTSPVKQSKKFKSKSVGGRKVARSPQSDEEPLSVMPCPVAGVAGKRRGGFPIDRERRYTGTLLLGVGGRPQQVQCAFLGAQGRGPFSRMHDRLGSSRGPYRL